MSANLALIDISTQPIELCKLLKIANMVSGGGEAKIVISEGYVLLNNEVEFQKRKKVYHDDIIEFNGETIQVNLAKASKTTQTSLTPAKAKNNTNLKPKAAQSTDIVRAKRKPISF